MVIPAQAGTGRPTPRGDYKEQSMTIPRRSTPPQGFKAGKRLESLCKNRRLVPYPGVRGQSKGQVRPQRLRLVNDVKNDIVRNVIAFLTGIEDIHDNFLTLWKVIILHAIIHVPIPQGEQPVHNIPQAVIMRFNGYIFVPD